MRNKIDTLLISFNGDSNTYYPVRDKKDAMEDFLSNNPADRKKIIDLEIFDSPSGKIM